MNRYLLFTGYDYYPGGGWGDFHQSYLSAGAAVEVGKIRGEEKNADWWHVVDIETGKIIRDDCDE